MDQICKVHTYKLWGCHSLPKCILLYSKNCAPEPNKIYQSTTEGEWVLNAPWALVSAIKYLKLNSSLSYERQGLSKYKSFVFIQILFLQNEITPTYIITADCWSAITEGQDELCKNDEKLGRINFEYPSALNKEDNT